MADFSISSHPGSITLINGLATYCVGEGQTVLVMPYPHGFSVSSMVESKLVRSLVESGYRVITFDSPGTFRSTRAAQVTMAEMLDCTGETIRALGISGLLSLIGHSMGGLCAIAYQLVNPGAAQKLVLIGTVSGGPAIARGKGMPWGMSRTDPDFWRFIIWGWRLSSTRGSLALHKKFLRLLWKHSYADRTLVPEIEILPEDYDLPAPIRDRWPMIARNLDYAPSIEEIRIPALVCVGRFDPQAPVACSVDLADRLPDAQLIVFEQSGHYPFIEEEPQFTAALSSFLAR